MCNNTHMGNSNIIITGENVPQFVIEPSTTVVSNKHPFLIDLRKTRDISTYRISIDENIIPTENIFIFNVKIIHIGKIVALFNKDTFNKDELFKKISPLKDVEINNKEVAISKVIKAIKLVEESNPVVFFYFAFDDFYFTNETIKEYIPNSKIIYTDNIKLPKKEKPKWLSNLQAKCPNFLKRFKNWLVGIFKKIKKPSWLKNSNISAPFKLLKKNFVHFIFVIISGFLIYFALSIAIYNSYAGKGIYVFFYICCLAGIGLNIAIFQTILKRNKVKSLLFIESLIFCIIGLAIGIGGFALYYSSLKEVPLYIPSKGKIILISFLISLGIVIIASLIPLLIKKIKELIHQN